MESSKVDSFLTKEGKGFGRKDSAVYQDPRAEEAEKKPDTHRHCGNDFSRNRGRLSWTGKREAAGILDYRALLWFYPSAGALLLYRIGA